MFLRHSPCPNCGSSDALAEYEDGHKWCFSCKYYEPPINSINGYRNKFDKEEGKHYSQCVLPDDFDYNIGHKGVEWLKKYSLSHKEIVDNRFGWSNKGIFLKKQQVPMAPLLVFPIYDQVGHLLMWQARNFGEHGPKYYTKGAKDCLHILGEQQGDTVIVTEDLISAIKVSRIAPAMPLWGSYLSLEIARRLSSRFNKVVMWLDKDKAQDSFKQAQNLSYLFKEGMTSIRTERDPKDYSTQELQEYLNE